MSVTADLTPAEERVLGLVAEGWSNGAIAERLVVTVPAVEKHVASVLWKVTGRAHGEPVNRRVLAALAFDRECRR